MRTKLINIIFHFKTENKIFLMNSLELLLLLLLGLLVLLVLVLLLLLCIDENLEEPLSEHLY